MTLPPPPALNQMAQADADRSEMCGETVVAAVLQTLGHQVSPEDVIAWLRATYGEAWVQHGTGGESPDHLVAALAHWSVAAHVVRGPIFAYAPAAVQERGHYVLCAIYSDSGGNPDPGHHTGHWILGFGASNYMNPYGGRLLTYPDLSAEDQQYGIEVDNDMGMTPQEKAAQDLVDALLVRDMYLGRISSLTDVQFTASRMLASDPEAGTWEITGSAEATATGGLIGEVAALRAELNAMRALLAQEQAATVVAAGSAAQADAVAKLQAEMAALAKAAGGQ
jgi:hypothetical protein